MQKFQQWLQRKYKNSVLLQKWRKLLPYVVRNKSYNNIIIELRNKETSKAGVLVDRIQFPLSEKSQEYI